ncbi:MAG: SigB/SigF/SigG family RNA polymerase sigma factor [Firmicutes bacterium]|nr:SigB/SigF/SigG family RNA polymerase sigma factor [Bacillota bacterium]
MQTDIFFDIELAKSGNMDARSKIVEENTGLVWSIVRRYLGRGHDSDDLYQVGCIGLIKAIQKFDTSYGVKFSTYAVPMIMGEIKRYIRDDGIIKVSRSLKELALRARIVKESLQKTLCKEPTVAEIAREMGIEVAELVMALDALTLPESLSGVYGTNDERELIEKIDDGCPEENEIIDRLTIKEALSQLAVKERQIITLRYFQQKTQTQIAKMLGISQVQVSRIEKRVLGKMRERLTEGIEQHR